MQERIMRSESDLLVFISSRQNDEMKWAREEAEKVIDEFPNCRPWAFEDMPASSQATREYYIGNADKADFVIWLVGQDTSQPVVDEIQTCMSVKGKLLAFMLPAKSRDELTEKLIQDVSGYAKWRNVDTLDELGNHIRSSLSDEINNQIHNPVPLGRDNRLKILSQESIARCKRSWTTLGVPDTIASELAQDRSVGNKLSQPTQGVQIVVGAQGVGKSLAVQRLLQDSIEAALQDASRPFPVFVKASNLDKPLAEYIESVTLGYAFPSVQGVLVIIDGLDEVGKDLANRIIDDVIPYAEANSRVTVVLTTRPLPGLDEVEQQVNLPGLDEKMALSLISKVAGRTVQHSDLWNLTKSIQDVATVPLFAVMIGTELRNDPYISWVAPSQLVDRFARRTLNETGVHKEEVDELLQDLAVKTVHSGGGVNRAEVHPRRTVQDRLADSRLVSEESGKFDFTLAVFGEWFAARAIVEKRVSLDELQPLTDRWIIPITIAIQSENRELAQSLVAKLAASDPGLASQVLWEAERSRFKKDVEDKLPEGTKLEIGQKISGAMEDWGRGLGELMRLVGPLTPSGSIATLGIQTDERMCHIGWYHGSEQLEPIVDLPRPTEQFKYQYYSDWPNLCSSTIPPTEMWPWVLTKDILASSLSEELKSRRLALPSPDAICELVYEFACAINSQGITTSESVKISEALRFLDESIADTVSLSIGGFTYLSSDMLLIRGNLEERLKEADAVISDPWPGPDKSRPMDRPSWMWHDVYTNQGLLDRTKAIYEAALRIYIYMVDKRFHSFGHRLRLRRHMPLKLEGRLLVGDAPEGLQSNPVLTWWPRPASEHEQTQVAFELGYKDQETQRITDDMVKIATLESIKYGGVFWHTTTDPYFYGFRPATELAHRWLTSELHAIGWT